MTDKVLISELTWRSHSMQVKAFEGSGMPVYSVEDDLHEIFRPTTRKTRGRIHVMSLAIIADKEKDFREFLARAKERKLEIVSQEDDRAFVVNGNCENIVKWWKDSRRNGSAKIGADISASRKREAAKAAAEKIRDRWPLPSETYTTEDLLEEAGISLNTAKTYLGRRPIEQANYRAKHKREVKEFVLDPTPKEKMDFCGLYVFQIDDDAFKIGTSKNSQNRLKQVSAYHKKRMKVVALFNMEIEKAQALEGEVHYRLNKYLHPEYNGREIFKTSLPMILRTIRKAKRHLFEVPNA